MPLQQLHQFETQLSEIHTMKAYISSNIADVFSVQYPRGLTVQFCPSKTGAASSKIILSSSNKTSVSV